jgi:hypothetical protein
MNRLFIGDDQKLLPLLQFLAEDFPTGATLIDPTGTLAEAAATILPNELIRRATYLDPADLQFPIGLNIFKNVLPDDRHALAQDICAYFDAIFPQGANTLARAQSTFILLNSLRVLLDNRGTTFLSVLKLLTDEDYRAKCIKRCTDPVVLANWEVIASWDKHAANGKALLLEKVGTLLASPAIRNMVGQADNTFPWKPGQIVIANLDRAKLGDQAARLFGSLLIARSQGPVYINDLGFFATDHLAGLLKQNRFTVACNFLDELPPKLRQAVVLIEQKAAFRVAPEDANKLAFSMGVMNPRILTERGEESYPPLPHSRRRIQALRRHTRARYSRPRAKVEALIQQALEL